MNNNSNQPGEFDAVLGGEVPPPVSGVVLGGIEGVKNRLKSSIFEVQIAALSEALNYGDAGLNLVIEALKNSSPQVKRIVAMFLKERGGEKGKQALLAVNPWLFFTKIDDYNFEEFKPDVGITSWLNTAYAVDFKGLNLLLKDLKINKIEALICEIWGYYNNYDTYFFSFINTISDNYKLLHNLKALFIGDSENHPFMSSHLELGDVTPILTAFTKLEVLQVRGGWGLHIKPIKHEYLKTLIVETGLMFIDSDTVKQICQLDLPVLEYLELWLGGCQRYGSDIGTKLLLPIISGELFPNLKYLGLRSSDYSDNIAMCLTELPTIIDRLAILDLSMGTLTDEGAKALLNFPSINQLHTLDVSRNYLSTNMIEELSQLDCQVITNPQANNENEESEFSNRYICLYE